MTISVALCTYNGQRFLAQQLYSIANQSRPPNEVIVCDDASSDDTPGILQGFQREAPFPVRLQFNTGNLGSSQNFAQAAALCEGDIIAFSDQDDLWSPHKLERLEETFDAMPSAGLVFSDATLMDACGQNLGTSLWACSNFTMPKRETVMTGRAFDVLLQHNVVSGAAMALRREWLQLALPLVPGPLIHDAWLALLIAAVAPIVALEEPLVFYRQHEAQHTKELGPPRDIEGRRAFYRDYAQQLDNAAKRLSEWQKRDNAPNLERNLALMAEKIAHLQIRAGMPASKLPRLPRVLRELATGRYSRFSNGYRSAASDLL